MKTSIVALAGAVLLATCPWALATSSADLSVTGSITPSACSPSVSNNGLVDYGRISVQDLNPTGVTELPKTSFKLAVNCEGASLFALATRDNRSSLGGPGASFVLGLITPTLWVGTYFLSMENIQLDDPGAYSIFSKDSGKTWLFNSEASVPTNTFIAFGNQSSGIRAPVPIKDVSLDLMVQPYIYPKNLIPVGETIALDGSATLELRYL